MLSILFCSLASFLLLCLVSCSLAAISFIFLLSCSPPSKLYFHALLLPLSCSLSPSLAHCYLHVLLLLFSYSFIFLRSCSPPYSLISLISYSSSLAFSNTFPTLFALLIFLLFYGYLFKKKKSKAFQHVYVLQRFGFYAGYCETYFESFESLCSGIAGDSPMFSMFRHWSKTKYQCCGSMTFWGGSGSGSADPCLRLMDPDPDSDPDSVPDPGSGSWYFRH